MNAVNRVVSGFFDAVLTPFELLGNAAALVLVSGIFGICALLLFKQISSQSGIKRTKDKIKGHMIAIRIYQDDLGVVLWSVIKIIMRNFHYLGLNFGPILPLFCPFILVAAQLVVRYAFAPLPVVAEAEAIRMLPGRGTMLEVRMKPQHKADVTRLHVELPSNLKERSPCALNALDGLAVMEFVPIAQGTSEIRFLMDGEVVGTKSVSAGDDGPRSLQPERVSSFLSSWLWPAEPRLPSESPIDLVRIAYPNRDLGFIPGGTFGVLCTFFLASILFGIAILRPLNIQI